MTVANQSVFTLPMQGFQKRLYSTASNSDFGSLLQLRNLINRQNVTSNPGRDVSAADDFFALV